MRKDCVLLTMCDCVIAAADAADAAHSPSARAGPATKGDGGSCTTRGQDRASLEEEEELKWMLLKWKRYCCCCECHCAVLRVRRVSRMSLDELYANSSPSPGCS